MAKKKTSDPEDSRYSKYVVFVMIGEQVVGLLRLIIYFGGAIGLAYVCVTLPVKYTAGKETTVNYIYGFIANARLDALVSSGAAAVFLGLWGRERKLRRDDIERLHKQVKEYEELLDPDRSTSGLTPRGETPRGRAT